MLFFIVLASCTASRKLSVSGKTEGGEERVFLTYGDIQDTGLRGKGFYIRKAIAEIESEGTIEKVSIILKKNSKDEYLASVRTRSGIEGARVLLTRDTLLVNDRINRMLISAKPESLGRLYGFSSWMLPLALGDINVGKSGDTPIDCKGNTMELNIREEKARITYIIECKDYNPIKTIIETGETLGTVTIDFGDFRKYGSTDFPREIRLSDSSGKFVVSIKIEEVEIPWEGEIALIPGEKYERIEFR